MAWLRFFVEAPSMASRGPAGGEVVHERGAFCWSVTDSFESAVPLSSPPPAARSSLDARTTPTPALGSRSPPSERWRRRMSLVWWVFFANGAGLVVALLLLTFSPIEIDAPIETGQFALLLAGFVVLVALNLVLLRRVLSPLFQLTELMSSVDPDR